MSKESEDAIEALLQQQTKSMEGRNGKLEFKPMVISLVDSFSPEDRLCFFKFSNSDEPITAYSDEECTIPILPPIIPDSEGRFPTVFLDVAICRIVIFEKNNGIAYEMDPYMSRPILKKEG